MNIQEYTSLLFEIEVNAHIAHLQTTSFAEHMALNSLYQDIVDIRDRFIESYQGQYGIINGYKSFAIKEGLDMISYINGCVTNINAFKKTMADTHLQQITDDLIELLTSTNYKLKNLK